MVGPLPPRKRAYLLYISCLRELVTAVFYKMCCRRRGPLKIFNRTINLLQWAGDLFPKINDVHDESEDNDKGEEVPEPNGFWVEIRGQKFRLCYMGDVNPWPAPKRAPFGPPSVFALLKWKSKDRGTRENPWLK